MVPVSLYVLFQKNNFQIARVKIHKRKDARHVDCSLSAGNILFGETREDLLQGGTIFVIPKGGYCEAVECTLI